MNTSTRSILDQSKQYQRSLKYHSQEESFHKATSTYTNIQTKRRKSINLQEEYEALKDKIKMVEEKNTVILKKIKDNMITVIESEQQSMCQIDEEYIFKQRVPNSLQQTNIYSDLNQICSSQDQFIETTKEFTKNNYERTIHQRRSITWKLDDLENLFEPFKNYISNTFNLMKEKIKIINHKYSNIQYIITQLKYHIHLKYSNKTQQQAIYQVRNRQNQFLIKQIRSQMNKITQQNQMLESELYLKVSQLQTKQQLIFKKQKQIQQLNKSLQSIKQKKNQDKKQSQKEIQFYKKTKENQIKQLQIKIKQITQQKKLSLSLIEPDNIQKKIQSETNKYKELLTSLNNNFQNSKLQIKNLKDKLQDKQNQVSKVSFQLMETQMMSQKIKQLFQQLQKQHQKLQHQYSQKQVNFIETLKKLNITHKSKLQESKDNLAQINMIIQQTENKIPKKMRKMFSNDTIKVEKSNIDSLKQIALALSYYQKKQNDLQGYFNTFFKISPLELQLNGFQEAIKKISTQIIVRDNQIKKYQQNQQISIKNRRERQKTPQPLKKSFIMTSPRKQKQLNNNLQEQFKRKQLEQLEQKLRKKNQQNKQITLQNQSLKIQLHQYKDKYLKLNKQRQLQIQQAQIIKYQKIKLQKDQQQINRKCQNLRVSSNEINEKYKQLTKQNLLNLKKISTLQINLQNQKKQIKKVINQYENNEKLLNDKIQSKINKNNQLMQVNNKLVNQLKQVKQQLQKKTDKLRIVDKSQNQKQSQQTRIELKQLNQQLEQKQKIIKQYQNKHKILQKKKSQIQQNLRASQSISKVIQAKKNVQVQQLKNQTKKLKQENSKLKQEKSKLQNRINHQKLKLKNEIQNSQKQKKQLQQNLKKKIEEFKKKEKELNKQIYQQTQEFKKLLNQKQKVFFELKSNIDKIGQLERTNTQIIKINQLKEKQLQQISQIHKSEIKKMQLQINNYFKKVQDLRENKKILQNLLAQKQSQIVTKQQGISNKNKQLNEKDKIIALKNEEIQHLKESLVQNDNNKGQSLKKLSQKFQYQIQANIEKKKLLDVQVQNLKLQLSKRQIKIKNLELQNKKKEQSNIQMKETLVQKQNQIFKLIQKNNDLKYQLLDDLNDKSQYIRQIRTDFVTEKDVMSQRLQFFQNNFVKLENQIQSKKKVIQQKQKIIQQIKNEKVILQKKLENINQSTQNKIQKVFEIENQVRQLNIIKSSLQVQNKKIKDKLKQLSSQIEQDQQTKNQFLKQIYLQHQKQIKLLTNKIKKLESNNKISIENINSLEKQLNEKKIQQQILQQKIKTQRKLKENLQKEINTKNNELSVVIAKYQQQIQYLKSKVDENQKNFKPNPMQITITQCKQQKDIKFQLNSSNNIQFSSNIISLFVQSQAKNIKNDQNQKQSLVTAKYVKQLKSQIIKLINRQRYDFPLQFINLHNSQAAYELSVLRGQLLQKNLKNSILQDLQFIDRHDFDFASRIDDQINDIVVKLQGQNHSYVDKNLKEVQYYKSKLSQYQAKFQQLNQNQEKSTKQYNKLVQFYTRQIKTQKNRADKSFDSIAKIHKYLGKILQFIFGKQFKSVQLKQLFQLLESIFQDQLNVCSICFQKYLQIYIKQRQNERQKSRKKGWF